MTPSDLKKQKQKIKKKNMEMNLQLRQVVRRHYAREEGQESHDTIRFVKRKTKNEEEKKHGNEPAAASGCAPKLRV
jgi:hypothetical protein